MLEIKGMELEKLIIAGLNYIGLSDKTKGKFTVTADLIIDIRKQLLKQKQNWYVNKFGSAYEYDLKYKSGEFKKQYSDDGNEYKTENNRLVTCILFGDENRQERMLDKEIDNNFKQLFKNGKYYYINEIDHFFTYCINKYLLEKEAFGKGNFDPGLIAIKNEILYQMDQNEKLEIIKNNIINWVKYEEYFSKFNGSQNGGGRFSWLKWKTIEFNATYRMKLSPYLGLQIYLYSIADNDIGNITEEDITNNEKIRKEKSNKFPFDYKYERKTQSKNNNLYYRQYYYLVGHNICLDPITGNLIKKPNELNRAQIWFYRNDGMSHNGILKDGFETEEYREEFYKSDLKERNFNMIKDYFFDLKYKKKLVSDEIVVPENIENWDCKSIIQAIEEMLG